MSPNGRKLDLRGAIHIAIPPEAARSPVMLPATAKDASLRQSLISAVPPVLVKSDKTPGGLPIEIFDQIREATAHRAQYYQDFTLPFYGYNRPGAKLSQGDQRQLVEAGHDGRDQGPVRLHQSLLRNGLH
jgi:non-heme chloroperoxidase